MKTLIVVDHPLIRRDLAILRDRTTGTREFRTTLRRISSALAFAVTHDLKTRPFTLRTPLERTKGERLADDVLLVPVLRAGLGMVEGFCEFLPDAKIGHVGMYRNEKTLRPVQYYTNIPSTLKKSVVLLLDPMLATGGSGAAALDFLKERGARRIRFVSLLAAPRGVKALAARHPDVPVFTCVVDRKLNEHGFILPGLGDAGDRFFGTE
jgi:uracil phosphoribosyltransferase